MLQTATASESITRQYITKTLLFIHAGDSLIPVSEHMNKSPRTLVKHYDPSSSSQLLSGQQQ